MTVDTQLDVQRQAAPRKWAKHGVWLGLLIAIGGTISYFLFFAQFAALRDVPWVNLPIVLLGVVLGAAGLWQIVRHSRSVLAKTLASATFLLTLGVAGLFNAYVFYLSYQLPTAEGAPAQTETAPQFALPDQQGQTISLADYRGRKPVIVFYRGYW